MQALKAQIFNDDLKGKLENPNLSLESWIAFLHERAIDVRIEKVETGKTMMGGKKVGYQVTYIDPMYPNMLPAVRTKSDFALLQNMLKLRFPDAVVPLITKGELDNLHLLELYIRELAANPFLRMDVTFSDFINGKLREFKQVKRNQKKMSEGTLRWLQQMTEYHEIDTPDEMIRSVRSDLDQLERAQRGMVKSFQNHIKALSYLQDATGGVSSALGDYLSMEQTSESNSTGSVSGLPAGRLRANLAKLIEVNQSHQNGLVTSYDGGSYERLMIHPVTIELKVITALKKVLDYLANAKSDFDKAKTAFDSVSPDDGNRSKLQQKLDQKNILFYKAKGALGFELEKFKTFRTVKFQDFFQTYVKFNLRGAKEINQQWGATGIALNQQEEEKFYAKDSFYKIHQANGSSSSPAVSKRITTKAPSNMVGSSNQSFQPARVNRPTFTGPSATSEVEPEDDDWSDEDEPSSFNPSSAVTLNRPKPPKAPSMPTMPTNYANSSPPSFGAPPKPVETSAPKPPVPTFGGGGFNAGPKPPMSSFSPPSTQPEIKAFNTGNPTPPSSFGGPKPPVPTFGGAPSSNFGGPPSSGFGGPPPNNAAVPSFGAPPSQNTNIPSFGGPPPQNTSLPTFGSPPSSGPSPPSFGGAPPSFGASMGGPKPPTAPGPKKGGLGGFGGGGKKAGGGKPKFGGGGGGGPPKLGGGMPGGGAGFLADIKKGNAVKLNKVPDADKSKEIGGDKGKGPGGAVVGGGGGRGPPMGGGGGGAPPRFGGGGGGMFGELSNKLKNRR